MGILVTTLNLSRQQPPPPLNRPEERTMGQMKIGGIVLIVVGLGLAYWGYQESNSLGSSLNQAFSGSPSDNVMLKYIGGAASLAVGAFLFTRK
jgi:hypothetical protein